MRKRILLAIGLVAAASLLVLGCSLGGGGVSRVTATPTKTPRPLFTATLTPMPSPTPTDTPVPTETPVPPTPTPLPTETPRPADTAVLPTDTPWPTETPLSPTATPAPPTNTPRPAATSTPQPPTNTPKPKVDFKVKEIVAFVDGSITSTGYHNIYFTVVDAGGAPVDNIIVQETRNQPPTQVVTGSKGPGKAEFTMYASVYYFKVVGNTGGQQFTSEETHQLTILRGQAVWDDLIRGGVCASQAACDALGQIHYSYNVTFQRTW